MARSLMGKLGCFAEDGSDAGLSTMTRRARAARATVGVGFLGMASAVLVLQPACGVVSWLTAPVLTWLGISHLVAAVTGYQGCPEIGAVASLVFDRSISTNCDIWRRIDRAMRVDRPTRATPA